MIINLSGEVNYEMFNQLIKAVSELRKEDNLHIYFTTGSGGQTDVAEGITDLVNKNKEYIGITFYGEVFSAGMVVFLKTTCQKYILPDTTGMYHYAWQQIAISEGGRATDPYGIFAMKEMKKAKIRTLEYLKTTKLIEKEIKLIKSGGDLYISYQRMLELL